MEKLLHQEDEAFCLEGQTPSITRYSGIKTGSFTLRQYSRNKADSDRAIITVYTEGRDFTVNYERGLLALTADSRVPDYRSSCFYGITPFNHENFKPGEWGNSMYTVYASYDYWGNESETQENLARKNYASRGFNYLDLRRLSGDTVYYLVLGDSISRGCEAFPADKAYFSLFAETLERAAGKKVIVENISIGGETTRGALARFEKDVLTRKFSLISIAYGMNDHNEINGVSCGVPLAEYSENLRRMISFIGGRAEILLVNFCSPNDRWYYHGTKTDGYAEAVRQLGLEFSLPVCDVNWLWRKELEAGKNHRDLLLNDINHPNNYGHRIYAAACSAVLG